MMEKEGEGGPVVRWERAENHGVWRPREKKIESDSLNHQKHRLKLPNHLHSWSWLSPSPPSSSLLSLFLSISISPSATDENSSFHHPSNAYIPQEPYSFPHHYILCIPSHSFPTSWLHPYMHSHDPIIHSFNIIHVAFPPSTRTLLCS